jgi:hypothetical protein
MWRDGKNPYRATPFQVLALDANLRGRAAIRRHIRARRLRIQGAPERFPLFGRILTEAEINEAEEQIQDPRTRLLAELRTHRPRSADVATDDLGARLAQLRLQPVAPPQMTANLTALSRLLPAPRERTFPRLWGGEPDRGRSDDAAGGGRG